MAYKLTYFDSRGRAEPIRYIFAQAGVEYEDIRIKGEDFPKLKESTPFGQLPMLEVDGKKLGGSGPIIRLLAERFGLAGSNDVENAELDSFQDFLNDFSSKVSLFFFEKDEARKAELKKDAIENQVPRYLGTIEKYIAANNAPEGWIYGKKVTYVDFRIAFSCDLMKQLLGQDIVDAYPLTKKLVASVEALPKIAEWIKKRPVTTY